MFDLSVGQLVDRESAQPHEPGPLVQQLDPLRGGATQMC